MIGRINVVAHNSIGQVVRGLNRQLRAADTELLEALAIFEGQKLTIERHWAQLVIETDAQNVINHISGVGRY